MQNPRASQPRAVAEKGPCLLVASVSLARLEHQELQPTGSKAGRTDVCVHNGVSGDYEKKRKWSKMGIGRLFP